MKDVSDVNRHRRCLLAKTVHLSGHRTFEAVAQLRELFTVLRFLFFCLSSRSFRSYMGNGRCGLICPPGHLQSCGLHFCGGAERTHFASAPEGNEATVHGDDRRKADKFVRIPFRPYMCEEAGVSVKAGVNGGAGHRVSARERAAG